MFKHLHRIVTFTFLLCAVHVVYAQISTQTNAYTNTNRFALINNNQEVFDIKTGLVWLRCRKDTQWNGTVCANTAAHTGSDYFTAMNFAKTQGVWRLPNIKELTSLLDSGAFVKKGVPSFVNRLNSVFNAYPEFDGEQTLQVWSNTPFFKEIGSKDGTPVLGGFYSLRFDTGIIKPGLIGVDKYDVMLVREGNASMLPGFIKK